MLSKNGAPVHFADPVTDADITNLVPKCSNACDAEEECVGLYVFKDGTTPKCRLLKTLGSRDTGEESTITESNDADLSCSYKRPDPDRSGGGSNGGKRNGMQTECKPQLQMGIPINVILCCGRAMPAPTARAAAFTK